MELFLDRQKHWKMKTSQHEACQVCAVRLMEHTMHYRIYMCSARSCTQRAKPCDWYLRTMMCDLTKRGEIEQHGLHVSSVVEKRGKKLSLQMKRFIREKVKEKLKPSRILNAMIDARMFDVDTDAAAFLRPITRYAYNYRTRGLGDNNDVTTLVKPKCFWAVGPTTQISPTPQHSGLPSQRTDLAKIRNLERSKDDILHVDVTFELNIGVSDVRRQFHPIAFFIVSDIRQAQLETVFCETFKMYEMVTGSTARIGYAMADADIAQRNALEAAVALALNQATPPVYVMCFFYVMQNVRKYITPVPKVHKHVYSIHYARLDVDLDQRIADAVSAGKEEPGLRDFERRLSQQWLAGRFTRWQCLWTPSGFAKTNNPVEQFNREVKRDYSLRTLLSVNALAQAFLDMCHHHSCRAKAFETTPEPSSEQARQFRLLEKEGRLAVQVNQPGSIAFAMEGEILHVFQTGDATTKLTRKKPLSTQEELDRAHQDVETANQPVTGWIVNVGTASCPCRNKFKLAYCVHLIAARLHQDLPVEGVQTKRTFVMKGKKPGMGRRAEVGHALAQE